MNTDRYQLARSQIGRYEIIGEIGHGGMGVVYRAYEAALDRTIAIKIIAPDLADQPSFTARLRREAISAARLRHPNIALLYEFGQADGVAFLAMEYVPGPALRELLAAGPLAIERALHILGQIGAALDYAHHRGIVHRDVKPSNILIGSGDHAVLIDFGLAEIAEGSLYTADGALLGTPHYMAPEQAAGRATDARSDQYALAAVAYEMLIGQPPFYGRNASAVVHAHIYDPPPPPTEHRPTLPAAVDAVLLRALAKAPHDRYPSLGAFIEDLRLALAGPPPPQQRKISRPRAAGLALALALVLIIALLLALQLGGISTTVRRANTGQRRSGVPLPQQVVWFHAPPLSGGPMLVEADGTLIIGTLDGGLLALQADTGEVRWRSGGRTNGDGPYGAPSAGQHLVFVGSADGQVLGLSPGTGYPVWRRHVTGAVQLAPTINDEQLVVLTDKGYVYMLQAGSGQILWSRPLAPGTQPPVVSAGRVFVSAGRSLFTLDARDGALLWQFDAMSTITTRPAIFGDLVLVGTERGLLHELHIVSGQERYRFQANNTISAAPAIGANTIFVVDRSGGLTALRLGTSSVSWHFAAGAAIEATPLLADGKLFFGASNGVCYALDAQSGALLARIQLGSSIVTSPALGSGLIYVRADKIYALGS